MTGTRKHVLTGERPLTADERLEAWRQRVERALASAPHGRDERTLEQQGPLTVSDHIALARHRVRALFRRLAQECRS